MCTVDVQERKSRLSWLMGSPVISSTSIEEFLRFRSASCSLPFPDNRGMENETGYPIMEDRLFFLFCQDVPEAKTDFVYFSTDDVYTYHPFCDVIMKHQV